MKKLFLIALGVSLLVPLSIRAQDQAEPTKLGLLLPLSGKFAELGEDCREGIALASQIAQNDSRLNSAIPTMVFADSVAEPRIAVSEFRKLVDVERVSAVLAVRSAVGMPVNPLSKSSKIPLIGVVGHREFASSNPYAYQYWSNSTEEGEALGLVMRSEKFSGGALITTEDEWLLDVSSAFKSVYLEHGGKLAVDEKILADEQDFRTILSRIKSRITADAGSVQFIVANLALQQLGVFVKQARESNITVPIYVNFFFGRPEQINIAGVGNSEGVRYIEMSSSNESFVSLLKRYSGSSRPNAMSLACTAGLLHVIEAIHSKAVNNSADLKLALDGVETITIDTLRIPVVGRKAKFPLSLMEIRSGVPKEVSVVVDPTLAK